MVKLLELICAIGQ